MPTLGASFIFAPPQVEKTNQGWHLDSVGFALVIMASDPASLSGGGFQYFRGPGQEAARLLAAGDPAALRNSVGKLGALPATRTETLHYPAAGYGCFMQGSHVLHRGQPLTAPGARSVFVASFIACDPRVHDATNWATVKGFNSPAVPREYVRHKAWRARALLAAVIDQIPLDAAPEHAREVLERASQELDEARQALGEAD